MESTKKKQTALVVTNMCGVNKLLVVKKKKSNNNKLNF